MSAKPEPKSIVVDVDQVDEDPDNARLTFDEAELKILGASLKDRQLKSIDVRSPAGGRRVLVDGARRLRAAKLAGIKQLRADDWGEVDAATAARMAATANLEREDLTPYEEARAFDRLVKLKVPKKEICEKFGIPFNTLQGRLELLELPETVAKRIGDARGSSGAAFGLGHAKALQQLAKQPKLLEAALQAFDQAPELPAVRDANDFVIRALIDKKLIANPERNTDLPYGWKHSVGGKATAAIVDKLPTVSLRWYNNDVPFVTDLPALEKAVVVFKTAQAEHRAKEAAAARKASVSTNPATAKAAKAKQELDRKLEAVAEPIAMQRKVAAVANTMQSATGRADVVWRRLAAEVNDNLQHRGQGVDALTFVALAKALKLDEDQVKATFAPVFLEANAKDLDSKKGPTWFTKAKPEHQLAFFVAATAIDDLASYWGERLINDLTGITHARFQSGAMNEAREELKRREAQSARDKAAAANLKSAKAHGETPKKSGDAKGKPAPSTKAAPAPAKGLTPAAAKKYLKESETAAKRSKAAKAKGKAAPKAAKHAAKAAATKRPIVETNAVKTARAKLAVKTEKQAQASLAQLTLPNDTKVVVPGGKLPPVASPREIADRVLAKPLQGLQAVQAAAKEHAGG